VKSSNLKEKISKLPQTPGSYIFKDKSGKIIYVGKAKNLRSRVKSYFSLSIDSSFKTAELVKRINDINFIKVESEFEALILEAELIKKYKPKYNIVLKDDRSNLYIVIRNEKISISGKNYLIPKVITARKKELLKKDLIFGPFPNSATAKNVLGTIRRVFPFRDCSVGKFSRYCKLGSPCLYGHMKLCYSPCILNTDKDILEYKKKITGVKNILSGKVSKMINDIEKEMVAYSKKKEFEKARECRDMLQKFSYVQEHFRDAGEYINNPYLIDDVSKKSIVDIRDFLPNLEVPPKRIECYDISNISGKEAVGSMVVSIDGRISKSEYKRFKIKLEQVLRGSKGKQDDFGMIYEVLYRRLRRESEKSSYKGKSWGKPDLIIVDGGKPQVSAALEVMKDLEIDIPVVGIAKKFEKLVYKETNGNFMEISVSKDTFGMKLIIGLRDESHRFAQSYHHLLRKRSFVK